jgi:NAD(P)H-dependent FMN reductase
VNIVIIGGSVRDERKNGKALRFAQESLKQRGHDVSVIDPKEDEFPLLNKMWKEYEEGEAPDVLERGAQKIKEADGVLLVSPEYNHSVPPALKNVLDHYLDIFSFKPSAIMCYSVGSFGGVRAMIALRSIVAEQGMPSIPTMYPIPKIQENLSEDGEPLRDDLQPGFDDFAAEFEWYMEAFARQ